MLDIQTLLAMVKAIGVISALLVIIGAWQSQKKDGVRLWIAAFLTLAASQFLRDAVTARFGLLAGYALGHLGGTLCSALLYEGVVRYLGLPRRTLPASALFAVTALLCVTALWHQDSALSLAASALSTALFQAAIALALWRQWLALRGFARLFAVLVFTLSALVSLLRAWLVLAPPRFIEGLHPNALLILAIISVTILQANCLVFLVNQSLLEQIRQAMSKLKATQAQLVLHEKMSSVQILTKGMAHEINNPANFAHAGAQILETELESFRRFLLELAQDDAGDTVLNSINARVDRLRAHTGTILDGTTKIGQLIKDLRTFSRLDEAAEKEIDIGQNLVAVINLVRGHYAHVFDINVEFQERVLLYCQPAQLNQVFINLIVNACHAIETRKMQGASSYQGKLSIRKRVDGNCLVLEFEDNGCGMPEHVIGHIFDPFYTTKEVGSATGLGLSTALAIVKRHRGKLEVRSRDGEGSCFTLSLPLAAPD